MQLVGNKENKLNEHQSPLENFTKVNENNSMVTIPQAEAARFLEGLSDSLNEIDSFKEYVSNTLTLKLKEIENFENTTVKTFNVLVDSTKELNSKIEAAGNYEKYLEERIENSKLKGDLSALELQLSKERAEISVTLKEISETVKKSISTMESKISELKSADSVIEEGIIKYCDKTDDAFSEYHKKAEAKLNDIADHLVVVSQSQTEGFRIKCEDFLKSYTGKAQENLEIVKKQSIDFLKQCGEENKKLISKVPAVSNSKFSTKDIIIYIISALTFIGLLLNIFM